MKICHNCGLRFESDIGSWVCDKCRLAKIRKRIDEKTSYPGHINDLSFLMNQLDESNAEIERLRKQDTDVIISYAIDRQKLIETLQEVHKRITDLYPGSLVKTSKLILKTLEEVESA